MNPCRHLALLILFVSALTADGASLAKARALRENGLLEDAKKEAIEVAFAESSPQIEKANAFLLLGDLAVEEKNFDAARENWAKVSAMMPESQQAEMAREKTKLLEQIRPAGEPALQPRPSPPSFPPGTVLVVPDSKFEWSAVEISAALAKGARPHPGSLVAAMELAQSHENVVGVVEIRLDTSSVFETGQAVCLSKSGAKLWEASVFYNRGGSEERIARRFVTNLAKKVKGWKCDNRSVSGTP